MDKNEVFNFGVDRSAGIRVVEMGVDSTLLRYELSTTRLKRRLFNLDTGLATRIILFRGFEASEIDFLCKEWWPTEISTSKTDIF